MKHRGIMVNKFGNKTCKRYSIVGYDMKNKGYCDDCSNNNKIAALVRSKYFNNVRHGMKSKLLTDFIIETSVEKFLEENQITLEIIYIMIEQFHKKLSDFPELEKAIQLYENI